MLFQKRWSNGLKKLSLLVFRPCHDSEALSLAFQRRSPASISNQSMWDLWRIKWRWNRFVSEYICFPLSLSFHQISILILIDRFLLPDGKMCLARKTSSQLSCLPFYQNQKHLVERFCRYLWCLKTLTLRLPD